MCGVSFVTIKGTEFRVWLIYRRRTSAGDITRFTRKFPEIIGTHMRCGGESNRLIRQYNWVFDDRLTPAEIHQ